MSKTAATTAYQLRPHKAIERNLFITLVRKLDRVKVIDIDKYRYVGFGAAFLDDFKAFHAEFGIKSMDSIESDEFAYTRQIFNNPYKFIKLYHIKSTDYINDYFKHDKSQIIWWDFAIPSQIRESLIDAELTAAKAKDLDILKFTFNAGITTFIESLGVFEDDKDAAPVINFQKLLEFFKNDNVFQKYWPDTFTAADFQKGFDQIIRALALRAVRRGLAKTNPDLHFYHLASFKYADGQTMTTITGIVCKKEHFPTILKESGLKKWEFYQADKENELIPAFNIQVPVMTVSERVEVDSRIHRFRPKTIARHIAFKYGKEGEHNKLIEGYCKYYRYLPYYSKVIY